MTKSKPMPLPRHCAQCGSLFYPRYNPAQFCSNACRQRAYRFRQGATDQRGRPRKSGSID